MKLLICLLALFSTQSFARNLDFNNSMFSTYLRGGMGLINLQESAFQPGFPTSVSFPQTTGSTMNYGGEIGFAYQSAKVCFRLGAEVIYPFTVTETPGTNPGGTSYMTLTSEVFSLIPKATLEFTIRQNSNYRFYFGGSAGYANTTIKNTVTMTPAGTAALGGLNSYIEEGSGSAISGDALVGIEFNFFDNVGFSFDAGYRYLYNPTFSATRAATTARGALAVGQTITSTGGRNRSLDLSGFYANGTFKIYIR